MVRERFDRREYLKIKKMWCGSMSLKLIARKYHVPEDKIAKILGLPEDPKEQERIYLETAFYDHGGGENHIWRRMEFYGEFLEDNDFETFMPACFMEKDDPEFLRLRVIANTIPKSDDPKKEIRRLWILNRFPEYKSPEWTANLEMLRRHIRMIGWTHPDGQPY